MASHITQKRALKQLEELHKFGEPERLAADEWSEEWQTLMAILMSARTRDDVTIVFGEALYAKFPTLESIASATLDEIEDTIKSINFFRNKAKFIHNCAKQIIDLYDGTLPHDIDKLVVLSGVGRKTANVFLAQYGHPAIGVDTHVIQTANALGWSDESEPDKIEQDLYNLFPKSKWNDVNDTCVHFGRTNQSKVKKREIWDYLESI